MSWSKSANLYSNFFLLQFQQSATITIIFRREFGEEGNMNQENTVAADT